MTDILIVEDDQNLADILRRTLSAEGFPVRVATTGEEGIRQFRERAPALVIMDLMLPGVDGWAAIEEMRKSAGRGSSISFLVLTAVEKRMDEYTLRDWGATDYLEKPFAPKDVVARVRRLLGRG